MSKQEETPTYALPYEGEPKKPYFDKEYIESKINAFSKAHKDETAEQIEAACRGEEVPIEVCNRKVFVRYTKDGEPCDKCTFCGRDGLCDYDSHRCAAYNKSIEEQAYFVEAETEETHSLREWAQILATNSDLRAEFEKMCPPQPIQGSIAPEKWSEKDAGIRSFIRYGIFYSDDIPEDKKQEIFAWLGFRPAPQREPDKQQPEPAVNKHAVKHAFLKSGKEGKIVHEMYGDRFDNISPNVKKYLAFLGQVELDDRFGELAGILQKYGAMPASKEQPDAGLEADLKAEYKSYVDDDPVFSKLVNRNAGLAIARHFAEWGEKNAYKAIMKEADKVRDRMYNTTDYGISLGDIKGLIR